jgi:GNAT superfamily N-acetyltransferase
VDSSNPKLRLRAVRDDDWPAILAVANHSVADVSGAGSQEEWVSNRRRFDPTRGFREHFLAISDNDEIVGYGAIESAGAIDDGEFRMFVVTPPERLTVVGDFLYRSAIEALARVGARRVRLTEYAADHRLRAFAEARGFIEHERFRIANGIEIVTLLKNL